MASLVGAESRPPSTQHGSANTAVTIQTAAAQTPAVTLEDAELFCLNGIAKSGLDDLEGWFTPQALEKLFPGVQDIANIYRVVKVTDHVVRIGIKLQNGNVIDGEFEIGRLITKLATMSHNPFIKAWGLIGTPACIAYRPVSF